MCMWGSICFLQHKTASLITCSLISATGTVLKQLCFAQLIESDFPYSVDLYLWCLKTCLPFSVAWHKPSKLHVLSFCFGLVWLVCLLVCFDFGFCLCFVWFWFCFCFFLLYSFTLFMVILLQAVFSLDLLLALFIWILPLSLLGLLLPRKKWEKITQKYNQQPCLSVDSKQIYSNWLASY